VVDVAREQFGRFALRSGDQYTVKSNFDQFDNRVDISGLVHRPGAYALDSGLTVSGLIEKAGGLKDEAYLNMAFITRKKENKIPEIIGFNLGNVLNGVDPDLPLQKDDQISISSLFDYREGENVSIWGAVKTPGTYPLIENITLKDLVYKAHGFTAMAATDSVELVRIIRDPRTLATTDKKTTVMKFTLDKDLNFKPGESDILLENGDQVIVRQLTGYEGIRMVRVEGEVLQPGTYNIKHKSERISDLIIRAGGLSDYAYAPGAYLLRGTRLNGVERKLQRIMAQTAQKQLESQNGNTLDVSLIKSAGLASTSGLAQLDSLQQVLNGTGNLNQLFEDEGVVGIDLVKIMKRPGSANDLYLEEGDVIYIPRTLQTVRVLGEVLFPTYVRYEKGLSLKKYINSAGGFSDNAHKKHTFVLYANGSAKGTTSFLGIKKYPPLSPGASIIVPQKPLEIKYKLSTAETISMMSSMATLAAVIVSLLR
jgi:protein involved in polysaccharide export with SLBB domain